MTDKTRTVVVIERHEQTIIRRSRRTVSSDEFPIETERRAVALPGDVSIAANTGASGRPSATAPLDEAERGVQEKRQSPSARLRAVAIKGVSWLRRMTTTVNERRKRLYRSLTVSRRR